MSMKAVTAPSPSKAEVKRQKAELMAELAEKQAELAVTRHSLDAEVGFKDFSVHVFGNFLRIVSGNFLGILYLSSIFNGNFNGTFNGTVSPQVREFMVLQE